MRNCALTLALAAALTGCFLATDFGGFTGSEDDGGTSGNAEAGSDGSGSGGGGDGGSGTDGGGGDGGGVDGASDAQAKFAFLDDFTRADTASGLGNSWVEKTPAFRIHSNTAERLEMGTDYRNNIATRPATELVRDVEVSVVFQFKIAGGGYVQIHARVKPNTVGADDVLDSYILFRNLNINDKRTFTIARQLGNGTFASLKDFQTSVDVNTSNAFRMRLRVTGTSPVTLVGTVELKTVTGFDLVGTATVDDVSVLRLDGAGVAGISAGGDPTGAYVYDDFEVHEL